MKRLYERYVLPFFIDFVCGTGYICRQRARVVPRAEGVVLDVGIGSGHNLRLLDPENVERVYGLDPEHGILERGRSRFKKAPVPVEILKTGAEDIPLDTHSVDTVVLTYTACTIPDVETAFEEMRRVLKPTGRLLFVEHGHSPDPEVARWQDRLNTAWGHVAGGCNLNRDMPALIEQAGFRIDNLETLYLPKSPRWLGYLFIGTARP